MIHTIQIQHQCLVAKDAYKFSVNYNDLFPFWEYIATCPLCGQAIAEAQWEVAEDLYPNSLYLFKHAFEMFVKWEVFIWDELAQKYWKGNNRQQFPRAYTKDEIWKMFKKSVNSIRLMPITLFKDDFKPNKLSDECNPYYLVLTKWGNYVKAMYIEEELRPDESTPKLSWYTSYNTLLIEEVTHVGSLPQRYLF
jgi:hypothetical protein